MIIGITGTNGSGKDTVADFLIEKLGWSHFSLSDELRKISKEKNIEPTRDNLIALGRNIRETHGLDYLSQRILKVTKNNFVVTSIRNPAEIEPFKKSDKFMLIAVDAPVEMRYQRVISAGKSRFGHKIREETMSLEEFKKKEQIEMHGTGAEQQLHTLINMADTKIENNGTIEELKHKVDELLKSIVL